LSSSDKQREHFGQCVVVADKPEEIAIIKRKLSDEGINKVPAVLADEFKGVNAAGQNAVVQRLINEHHAKQYTFGQNIGLKADDDFVNALETHNLAANSDLYVDAGKLTPKMRDKMQGMSEQLKRCGVLVRFIENGALKIDGERKEIIEFNLKFDRQTDHKFDGKILEIVIPEGMTEKEIKDAFEKLDLSQMMFFRSSEVRNNINKLRDIVDRKSFSSFFDILVNLGKKEIKTEVQARNFGRNWELPLAEDSDEQIKLLVSGDLEGLKRIMDPASAQVLIDENTRLAQNNLQKEFMEGVTVKTMIKAKLREKDKQCALEVMSNRYKINETDYKNIEALALKKIREPGKWNEQDDEAFNSQFNSVVFDWRLSKPIRKEGLGVVNTSNVRFILGAG
jgi:hypothetical protein